MLQSCPINSGHDLEIVVNGIANGLAHLHSMAVLHNHLVCDNISLVAGGDAHRPVLIEISFACRFAVAKIFSPKVINPFCGNVANLLQREQATIMLWPRFQIKFYLACIVICSLTNMLMLLGKLQFSDVRRKIHMCLKLSLIR